jgi:hypothetical protein
MPRLARSRATSASVERAAGFGDLTAADEPTLTLDLDPPQNTDWKCRENDRAD